MQWPAAIKPTAADAAGTNKRVQGGKHLGGMVAEEVVSHVDVFATIAAAASVGGPPLSTVIHGKTGGGSLHDGKEESETTNNKTSNRSELLSISNAHSDSDDLLREASQLASQFLENGSAIIKEHYAMKLFKKLIKGVLHVYQEAIAVPNVSSLGAHSDGSGEYRSPLHSSHLHIDEVLDYFRNTTVSFVSKTKELIPEQVAKFNRLTRSRKNSKKQSGEVVTETSAHGVHSEYMIDGINLLPFVASPTVYRQRSSLSTNEILHSHYLLANNASVSDRILFWRSGNYAAVQEPSTQYKLQVSKVLVEKIWFMHLGSDPYEHVNIAALLGITTVADLELARDVAVSDPALKVHKEHLYRLYDALLDLQKHQSKPLWPALIEFPTAIDKTAMEDEVEGDEYIYWAN